ncbi:hypothetical protein CASFOL_031083 [Castilleja foliolosa]|uniref:Uncharacterized protein n=1 Tax=Castilleja foliolosa TaxID=1961234 RepID=A0ABD3C6H1_9LAMI
MSELTGRAMILSKIRARSRLPTEITDSKMRSTVTEPVEEFTNCSNGVTSYIDELFIPPLDVDNNTLIPRVFQARPVEFLGDKLSENQSDDFLATAKLHMKDFLKFVEEGVPIPTERANSLLRGVWLNSDFAHPLSAALDLYEEEMICQIMFHSNEDSFTDRIARMEADPYFKLSVMGLKLPTPTSTFLRLFSSILICYCCDKSLLRVFDQIMGTTVLGPRLDLSAKMKVWAIERAAKKDEIERFSFVTEDISQLKDMEPLRQMFVARYAPRDIDVEDIIKKLEQDLHNVQGYPSLVGKKIKINIKVNDGRYWDFSVSLNVKSC